jgi:hypothetical protein
MRVVVWSRHRLRNTTSPQKFQILLDHHLCDAVRDRQDAQRTEYLLPRKTMTRIKWLSV